MRVAASQTRGRISITPAGLFGGFQGYLVGRSTGGEALLMSAQINSDGSHSASVG